MKIILLTLTCAAIAVISLACTEMATPITTTSTPIASPAGAATPVDEFAAARVNYAKNCEGCHGETAVGGLVKVDGKQIKVPSLKSDHAIKHTDEQLTKMITNGEEAMPSFKDKLKPEEIADLVRFVRKNFQGK